MVARMSDRDEQGVSRRDFLTQAGGTAGLLGSSVVAAQVPAMPAALAATPARAAAPPPQELGPGPIPVQLLVNGKTVAARVEPRDTLAHVLRESLGLSGTKIGCDRGACGACTVWVDGTPTNACMTLALDVAGVGVAGRGGRAARAVTTIEGLAPAGKGLHPVQQAFVGCDALQCGFCTPGMVMSCAALYERKRAAGQLSSLSESEVRDAVAGNLCRCGSYPHVISAVMTAAGGRK